MGIRFHAKGFYKLFSQIFSLTNIFFEDAVQRIT
jgi:hypothetical protein